MKQISQSLNRFVLIYFVSFIFIVILPVSANAVNFANDAIFLYSGDARIAGDRVVVKYSRYERDVFEVCENGAFWIRQGPDWHAGPYEFYWHDNADAMMFERWVQTEAGRSSKDVNSDYHLYLTDFVQTAPYHLAATLPDIDECPPLEIKPSSPPRRNMTGGRIGSNRYFRLELQDGVLTQITRSEVRNSPVLNLPDSPPEF